MDKKIRKGVEEFYTEAAMRPDEALCCATAYGEADVGHIPQEVLDVSYGCGSPVPSAGLAPGDTLVDLGSGGGIDCFMAARSVGPEGRVIGVDMTDEMLGKARWAAPLVAESLGYDVVEFRKGFLEELPVEDGTADVITSNCVVNLSPDKGKVFAEAWRVLKPRGRFCIADVVAAGEIPGTVRKDPTLWGECIAGALTEEEFIRAAREAGFYGMTVTSRTPYREVKGVVFNSATITGYKFAKQPGCVYAGHKAAYDGPFESVTDDEGHIFPAGVPVEVCTDTAEKLTLPPYRGIFTVTGPEELTGKGEEETPCCPPTPGCC